MSLQSNFQLMSTYNQWMNNGLYELASPLTAADLARDRGVYFGSVLGTFNHILVGDTIWLKRFSDHPSRFAALQHLSTTPSPQSLAEIAYPDFTELRGAREEMDAVIVEFAHQATDSDYEHQLSYRNTKGILSRRKFGFLVHHFFNHQTHHRGQMTALFSQMGLDFGSTDLLAKIPEVE